MAEIGVPGTLYPFQQAGVSFLASHRRAYLADDMGLGKTVQAIVATHTTKPRYTVVVCPASVRENWKREWRVWGGRGDLHVVSYSGLIRLDLDATTGLLAGPDLVILDEAQYCKTPGSKRTKAALKLGQRAEWCWLLSGTPMPNDPRELYAVFKYLWPEIMRVTTAFAWMDRYCKWSVNDYGYTVWGVTPLARTELGPVLRKIMLRRKLMDVALELPPLRFTAQSLPRDPELRDKLVEIGADPASEESMSTLRRVLGEYKAPKVARVLLEELQSDPTLAMVVMYHHHRTGAELADVFSRAGVVYTGFDGSVSSGARQLCIDLFQDGTARVFLAQQTAAGVGITLTRASEIVLVEPSWSPSDNDQAIKRIHRIGQDQPCRARIFVVPDSLDEQVMGVLLRKQRMLSEIGL